MKDEHLDKLFRDSLRELEATPSRKTWEIIQTELTPRVIPLYKRSLFLTVTTAAAVILIIIVTHVDNLRFFSNSIKSITNSDQHGIIRSERSTPKIARTTVTPSEEDYKEDQLSSNKRNQGTEYQIVNITNNSIKEVAENMEIVPIKEVVFPLSTRLRASKITFNSELTKSPKELQTYKVVEIGPIQPLIESPEHKDQLLANSESKRTQIIPAILNKITEVINPDANKIIQFSHDEEGSFHLDISNSYVKSRFKKRK